MSKLHKVNPSTIKSFEIIANEFSPKEITQVKRTRDGAIFTIGDYVTNGTQMRGNITEFEFLVSEETSELTVFVAHTWSGIGMNLESIFKINENSEFAFNDNVTVAFLIDYIPAEGFESKKGKLAKIQAKITGVHHFKNKIKYDLELNLSGEEKTRIYMIDSIYVHKYTNEK